MKVYVLKDEDFERLHEMLAVDPKNLGSGRELTTVERQAYAEAHRRYNYVICNWIAKVKK